MKVNNPVRIVAAGKYLPQKVDSAILEAKYDIPIGWAEKNSGVKSRHMVTFESNAYMGARAIEKALEKAGMKMKDIDLLISAGATYDYPLPNQASVTKSELKDAGDYHVATLDIDTTCLSFVSAFEVAAKMLDGKQYKNIIIVCSEVSTKGLNPNSRETATLFGDAAVAVILQYDESGVSGLIKGGLRTYSEGVEHTIIKGGGNKYFFKDHPYNQDLHSFHMNGIKLLKLAKKKIPEFMDWFFQDLNATIQDVDIIIPHQASKTGLIIFTNLYTLREDVVKGNLVDHGNCISASIPLVLHDLIDSGEIKRGDICMLTGTSAGFSIGGVLIKY